MNTCYPHQEGATRIQLLGSGSVSRWTLATSRKRGLELARVILHTPRRHFSMERCCPISEFPSFPCNMQLLTSESIPSTIRETSSLTYCHSARGKNETIFALRLSLNACSALTEVWRPSTGLITCSHVRPPGETLRNDDTPMGAHLISLEQRTAKTQRLVVVSLNMGTPIQTIFFSTIPILSLVEA